jgi:membrane-associated protease RseP (regulator of RpoE activity)
MVAINGGYIALLAVAIYALVIYALHRAGRLGPDRALSLYGPALMVKTRRGRSMLDRLGRFRRFWSGIGDLGLVLVAVAMVIIVIVLLFDAVVAAQIHGGNAPSFQEALGIPGLNPFIPLGYGLVALVIGVVLHELMHGVLARSQKIGVKSLGVLWLVIPIGAFVEQDEEEMLHASRRRRDRVAAAGVLANFVLALIFFVALAAVISGSVHPAANGVGVAYVVPGTPAQNVSLQSGDIITAINGTPTPTDTALLSTLASSRAGETIALTFYHAANQTTVTAHPTLAPLSFYTHNANDSKRGFLGVAATFLPPAGMLGVLSSPLTASGGAFVGVTSWVVLPLSGLEPVQGTTAGFFHLTGPLAGLGTSNFWILANLLYWLAWMNLLLGLSNSLPLFPLDGGLLFRDFIGAVARRVKRGWDAAKLDAFAGRAAVATSVFILGLIVWQFVAPRL